MSGAVRTIVLALGALCLLAGTLMLVDGNGGGIGPLILGALLFIGIVFDRGYGRPGQQPTDALIDWRKTGERFVDEETGQPVEVWTDPRTGGRRYEPMKDHPPLPRHIP